MYVPLWAKSNFSFLEGASHPHELVAEALRLGLPAIALTDRDGVYGVVRAHLEARGKPIKLIIGSQITLEDGSFIVLLVQNREGYARLCRLISIGRLRSEKGQSRVSWEEVQQHAEGLLALWGGMGSRLADEVAPDALAADLKSAFGDRLYALVARHQDAEEEALEARLRERAAAYGLPIVAGMEVLYHHPDRRALQDVLTSLRHGCTLMAAGKHLKPNDQFALCDGETFAQRFADDPEAVARTLEVAARCDFAMSDLRYRYPSERLPDGTTTHEHLRRLTFEGAHKRYPDGVPDDVIQQLEHELALIEKLDFGGYFLTMHEIVKYCEASDILCQGRGSAANSAVCFCLGVTAVDPVRMGLLFERFLSEERAEAPDIDLDIEHRRREEVIQHVYEKYGRDRAAMVAVVITYRMRSAVRDVGKALGLPETELGRLARAVGGHHGAFNEETLRQSRLHASARTAELLLKLSRELYGFPRHLSIHPGGFLLGHEPICQLVPIENGTMEARTVIQWDKDDVEALGLFKVDLLGLGALHHLHRVFDLLRRHRGLSLSMARIPPDDAATFAMLQRADTLGVFQVESRAQMSMLPRLKPRSYYDLVIEISLVRPGPLTGGMVHPYLRRRAGEEAIDYPHKDLEPVLERTLGIPLFQEQVMKLAIIAADYTPGEADQLRRDMAAWKKVGSLAKHRERLIGRMVEKGIAPAFAERVFKQIEGFADYGFPEAHAASFALISYAGAYLRCHHPIEFACGLLNSLPMGFYSAGSIVQDARRQGVVFLPVDALASEWDSTMEPHGDDFAVRLGWRCVKGLGDRERRRLEAVKSLAPKTLEAFVWEAELDIRALCALAEAGAFACYGKERREALWEVRGLVHTEASPLPDGQEVLPALRTLSIFETINWDHKRTSLSPLGHPLGPLRPLLTAHRLPDARTIAQMADKQRVRYAGVVICRQRPGTAGGVVFMTLEDETGFVNLVVWEKVFTRYKRVIVTTSFLGVSGTLQVQHGIVHLIASRFWVPEIGVTPASVASYDFH
ncbi:MAG TPA: error-prone DNA polymerase [Oscillatoriaceae cyanobacterium]